MVVVFSNGMCSFVVCTLFCFFVDLLCISSFCINLLRLGDCVEEMVRKCRGVFEEVEYMSRKCPGNFEDGSCDNLVCGILLFCGFKVL